MLNEIDFRAYVDGKYPLVVRSESDCNVYRPGENGHVDL